MSVQGASIVENENNAERTAKHWSEIVILRGEISYQPAVPANAIIWPVPGFRLPPARLPPAVLDWVSYLMLFPKIDGRFYSP